MWAIWYYRGPVVEMPDKQTELTSEEKFIADKKQALALPNPQITVTENQVQDKKAELDKKNPMSNLTAEQIRQKQAILESI